MQVRPGTLLPVKDPEGINAGNGRNHLDQILDVLVLGKALGATTVELGDFSCEVIPWIRADIDSVVVIVVHIRPISVCADCQGMKTSIQRYQCNSLDCELSGRPFLSWNAGKIVGNHVGADRTGQVHRADNHGILFKSNNIRVISAAGTCSGNGHVRNRVACGVGQTPLHLTQGTDVVVCHNNVC